MKATTHRGIALDALLVADMLNYKALPFYEHHELLTVTTVETCAAYD